MVRIGWRLVLALGVACGGRPVSPTTQPAPPSPSVDETATTPAPAGEPTASVTAVEVSGSSGAYSFAVTVRSDETGCDRYADWWEVVDADGALVYRRILTHSHPDEQPFTRSGGPVDVGPDDELLVRAHLNLGYAGAALRGSVADGFTSEVPADGEATDVETVDPQPDGCLF